MLKKEYELLTPFIREPWKKFTFKEVKTLLNKTSESYVYSRLKNFVKQGILKEEKAGNVTLYLLDLASLKTQAYTGFVAEHVAWSQSHIPFRDLQDLANKIPTQFYTFIITGSYASKKQTEQSDIDVVILVDNAVNVQHVYAQLKHYCEMNIPPIHLYVFKESEFLEMLLNNQYNYGKEIAKNNLLLYGAEVYYRIMNEAIGRGYKN